jgi:pentose-5-phosphate-3-epimerase
VNYIIEAQFTCTADGTCTFQWAQNISDAGATSVKAGSNLMFARVN